MHPREIFVEEIMKIRGVKRETAVKILNMEENLRHEIAVALRDAYEKGKTDK